jgi:hypothetical protein
MRFVHFSHPIAAATVVLIPLAMLIQAGIARAQTDDQMAPFGQALTDLGYKSHAISSPNEKNNWRYINDTMKPADSFGRSKISQGAGAVVYPSEDAAKKDWETWRDMAISGGRNPNVEVPNVDGQICYVNTSGLPNEKAGTILMTVEGRLLHGKANVVIDFEYTEALAPGPADAAAKKANANGRQLAKEELFRVHQMMVQDGCFGEQHMQLTLDRTSGPRFSAILVSGSGFGRGRPVDISFNGKHIFNIARTMADGAIPPNAWIWIPDSAPLDKVSEVVAVVMDPAMPAGENDSYRPKSNVVKVNVTSVSPAQMKANFNALCELYIQKIPPNPLGYKSGTEYNIKWAVGWVKDNQWCCGGYQAQVLKLLDGLRFNPDPKQREILDGLDYGPIFSFLTTTPLTHCFVVVWPHGPALTADALQVGFDHMPTWEKDGVVFDPWRIQKPEFYLLHEGDAGWAAESDYAYRWRNSGKPSYAGMTANPEIENIYKGCYPCDGGDYYDWKVAYPKVGGDRAAIKFIEDTSEVPQAVNIRCPVAVDIADTGGHHAKLSADGNFTSDLASAELASAPEAGGGVEWLAALPKGKYTLTMTGTGDGTLEVMARRRGSDAQTYPKTPLKKGTVCTLVLDDALTAAQPLTTDKGESLSPKATPVERTPAGGVEIAGSGSSGGTNGGNGSTGASNNPGNPSGNPSDPGSNRPPVVGNTGGGSANSPGTAGAGGTGGATIDKLPPQITAGKNLRISRIQTFRRITNFPRGDEAQSISAVKIADNGSSIYFASDKGTFTINPDGTGLRQISKKPAALIDLSADGGKLAWYEGGADGLFTANGDGSERTPMPGGFNIIALRMTADGSKLFILSPEKNGLFVMPSDGSDVKRVTTTAAVSKALGLPDENGNSWRNQIDISSDGSRIAMYFLWDVLACSGDGSNLHPITRYKGPVIDRMRLSPDGTTIVHMRNQSPNSALVFTAFDGSPIAEFKKSDENISSMQIASDNSRVWISSGVRNFSRDGHTMLDACDCGAGLWAPANLSMTSDQRRGCFQIDGPLSTDQGRPSQLMIVNFNPQSIDALPSVSEINGAPKFMLADGSSTVRVTMKSSDPEPRSIGAALIYDGHRPPNLANTWYGMNDNGTDGDETKGDGIFTTKGLCARTYDGKPLPAGPVTLRVHILDKDWNLTVVDLDGLEVRTP